MIRGKKDDLYDILTYRQSKIKLKKYTLLSLNDFLSVSTYSKLSWKMFKFV